MANEKTEPKKETRAAVETPAAFVSISEFDALTAKVQASETDLQKALDRIGALEKLCTQFRR